MGKRGFLTSDADQRIEQIREENAAATHASEEPADAPKSLAITELRC